MSLCPRWSPGRGDAGNTEYHQRCSVLVAWTLDAVVYAIMKVLSAVLLLSACVPSVYAQYPKTITLTVTKITRTPKDTPDCIGCSTVTRVEAHTRTANFELSCESTLYPGHEENNSVCSQFETGEYVARMLSPEVISFWTVDQTASLGTRLRLYEVRVEEARAKN
jgi:hypothetical protein